MASIKKTTEKVFSNEATFNESLAGAPKVDTIAEAFADDFLVV
jgi:hypothetical protein